MADVSFNQTTLNGYGGAVAALQWGPDGRLYVAERFGDVKVLTVEKTNGAYTVTDTDTIGLVKDIANHDDDGSLNASLSNRQVTGIVVGGTAENPVVYVSSSDPRIGAGNGGADKNLDTNSGVISRLTMDANGGWEKVDIVRGLPRSEENHATNGLELSADGSTLYVAQGGHANAGAPSNNFAGQVEYAYSAAILSVDLDAIDQMDVKPNGDHPYVYDLPTLDDPDRPNDGTTGNENPDGSDVSGPFGGNDGFNMARITADSPVQVHSPGYRNPYDVLLTEDGQLYTYDNGANAGWGGFAVDENGAIVTDPSQTATNQANEDQGSNKPKNYDNLHLVEEGAYGGHPNPIRAAGEDAGLLVSPNSGTTGSTWLGAGNPGLPADFAQVVDQVDPRQGVYQEGGFADTALDTGKGSVNGLAEYTASVTWTDGNGGETSIKGALLATDYNGEIYIIPRDGGGVQTTTGNNGQTVAEGKQVISLGGGGPLGIDAVGDGEPFAGTIWVGKLNNGQIAILEPGEGSAADTDLDNDGLDNTIDPFALDADNGTAGSDVIGGGEVREYPFESGSQIGTFGGAGFTGAMTNGEDAFEDGGLFEADNIIAGGAGGVVTFKSVAEGDTYAGENGGRDNLQFGITLDDTVGEAAITLTMNNWLPGAASSGGFPSAGMQIGTGGQDDYVKLVLGGRKSSDGDYAQAIFESGMEDDGTPKAFKGVTDNALLDASNATWVQLRMVIDPDGGTVTPQWRYGTGVPPEDAATEPTFTSGAAIKVPDGSALLDAIRGDHTVDGQASGLAVGLIATSNNGTPFQADFDGMTIITTEKPATPAADQAEVDAAGTDGYDRVAYSGTEDIVLPADVEEIDLTGNTADVAVTGSAGDNVITGGEGANTLAGGGGADTFRGTAAGLDGDTITDLDADDAIEITGVDAGASLVDVVNGSATLKIDTTGDGAADTDVTLTGAPFEGANTTAEFDVTVENGTMTILHAPGPGPVVAAINAGTGGALTQEVDGESVQFSADQYFTGGQTYTDNNGGNGQQPVYDGTVFETERYGDFSYAIPNLDPSKQYVVQLVFAEIFTNSAGAREMDVEIEGTLVLDDLDVVGETGNADVPYSFTSEPVSVGANGTLDIAFTTVVDNAKISGIVVREADGTPPADADGPDVASITVAPPEAGDADATVTVVYTDPSGVSLASIGANDIAVTGPAATGPVSVVSSTASGGGSTLTVVYAVADPAGGWTDGAYGVEVLAGEVTDEAAAANGNASAFQAFDVQTTTSGGEYIAINAGGPDLTMDGFDYVADTAFTGGASFKDNNGGNGQQPVFDGTVYETERNSDAGLQPFSYSIDVSGLASDGGLYDLTLHFAELYQSGVGDRVMDVFVEGKLVLDDLDILAVTGDINTSYDFVLEGIDAGANGAIDVRFEAETDRAAVTGLRVEASEATGAPPPDAALGVNIGDFSDDPDAPTAIDLALGSNVVRATQGNDGGQDYDYLTFTVAEGQVLTSIRVDGFEDYDPAMANSVFIGMQAGTTFTEGPTNPDPANMLGGVVFGEAQVGTDILADMADGVVEPTGAQTIGFDAPLAAGDYTLWFSQNQMRTTATLDFEVEAAPMPGAVRLGITENVDDVQASNFGSNSFVLENVGGKSVASVAIDVTGALYPDTVFDPFGGAGDAVAKKLTINTEGGTGVVAPTDATSTDFASMTATYVGAGGASGFEGVIVRFDEGTNGGFEAGESVGFAVDMDPNSIAGAEKKTLDEGSNPSWDVGGVSGAELIGSSFTVTFTDGTTATGQVHGAGNQAGAVGLATQASPNLAATLTVGDTAEGEAGTYGSETPPAVIVDGPAGETVRVVMSMGMIQPEDNGFAEPYAAQLQAQLDALAASDFPANNAAEFQTVDVVLTGTPQDITSMFDFTNVDDYDVPGEGTLPLAFASAVIDPATALPKGPVSQPVYLTHDGVVPPEPGAYLPNANGDIVFEVEDAGLADQDGWTFHDDYDEVGHEAFTGEGYYRWEGGNNFKDPGEGVLSYEFTPGESGVYYLNLRASRVETSDNATEQNDSFARVLLDGAPVDMRDGYKNGIKTPDYKGDQSETWAKVYQSGGGTDDWIWANKNVDNVGIPVAYELEAGQTYTLQLSGRSNGHEIDRVHLEFVENPPDPAAGQTTNPVNPPEDAPLSPRATTEDLEAPTAVIVGQPATNLSGAATVEITYSDDVALDPATIDATDVTLTGPDGTTVLTAASVTTAPQPDGSIVATYSFDAPASGFALGDYTVNLPEGAVLDAEGKPVPAGTATLSVGEPTEDAAARIGVNLNGGIDASTYGGGTMTIANESGSGQTITSVTFDLAPSLLPAMVFDPVGSAGDQLGKGFDANSGAATVGLVTADAATGAPPFGSPFGNGGYETLTIEFGDFDAGETFGFSVDIDPASIEGSATTGSAGSVSGLELSGSTVTVGFSDGTSYTGALFADNQDGGAPSAGGAEALVRAGLAAAPTLSIAGVSLALDAQAEAEAASVAVAQQTVEIDGGAALAGMTVRVLVVEADVGTDGLSNPQDAFDDLGAYGGNRVVAVDHYDVVLDASGQGTAEVMLGTVDAADDGRNVLTAAVIDANGEVAGLVSAPIALVVDPASATSFAGSSAGYALTVGPDGFTVTDTDPSDGTEPPRTFGPGTDALTFGDGVVMDLGFEDGVPASLTRTDVDDAYAFDTIASTFAPDGTETGRVRTDDNGDVTTTTYDGPTTTSLLKDVSDTRAFDTFETVLENGERVKTTAVQDNRDVVTTLFEGGVRVSSRKVEADGDISTATYDGTTTTSLFEDVSDSLALATFEAVFEDGERVQTTAVRDNGDVTTTTYDGPTTTVLVEDVSDTKAFDTFETVLENGERVRTTAVQDNGDVVTTLFEGGVRVSSRKVEADGDISTATYDGPTTTSLFEDVSDSLPLATFETVFENGERVQTTAVRDNGDVTTTIYDASNTRAFDTFATVFQNGERVRTTAVQDNRDVVTTLFEGGERTSYRKVEADGDISTATYDGPTTTSLFEDVSDSLPLATFETVFENGERVRTRTVEDDGDILTMLFEGGKTASRVFEDISDTRDWASYTDAYEDGVFVGRTFVYDGDGLG